MGRKTTRKVIREMKYRVDKLGSIITALDFQNACKKFNKILEDHDLLPCEWHSMLWPNRGPKEEGYYLTITKVPVVSNTFQLSVKYYDKNYKFGDISTKEWEERPHPQISELKLIEYEIRYPCADDVIYWAEIQRTYGGGAMVLPAIQEKVKIVRK